MLSHRLTWVLLGLALGACRGEPPSTPIPPWTGGARPAGTGGATPAPGTGGAAPPGAAGELRPDSGAAADGSPPDVAPPAPDVPAVEPGPPTPGRTFRVTGVATWRGNAAAAYSLIHDDVCDPSVDGAIKHAAPMLRERGLRAGFGVIVDRCVARKSWAEVRALAADGHDVFNHSWSHPCLGVRADETERCSPSAPRSMDYMRELEESTRLLRAEARVESLFFIFPYDVCTAGAIERLRGLGYLGARCGDRSSHFNTASFADPFALQFDVWGPAYSEYGQLPPCDGVKRYATPPAQASPACRLSVLNRFVDDVITRRGWAVRELHGFADDPGGFEPISVADYAAHLDHVAPRVKDGRLWVEGPTSVIKYRFAREQCPAPVVSGRTLTFAPPSVDCRKHATILTYLVTTSDDPAALSVVQDGVRLPGRKLAASSFAVEADPTRGEAIIE